MTKGELIPVYKPLGWTPLEAVKALLKGRPDITKACYAGRLDPMAEGVLLVLTDEETHKLFTHTTLDKEYEAELLIGFETDSHDLLGIPREGSIGEGSNLATTLLKLREGVNLPLPDYASYRVHGKPLFVHARAKRKVETPTRFTQAEVTHTRTGEVRGPELLREIREKIGKVKGDFRQGEILSRWEAVIQDEEYPVVSLSFATKSGVYIRSIAHWLGKELGSVACVKNLIRTRVGPYTIAECVKIAP